MIRRFGPVVTAVLMLAMLVGVRLSMRADAENVWLLGKRTDSTCTFRQAFGIPCPNCGMTRSFVLAVHGDVHDAMLLNPAGPLLVAGVLAAVVMLLGGAASTRPTATARWILPSVIIYAAIYALVLFAHWLTAL
ncbi:MAG TPA: DUF2752 domain-containing protein [Bryobacteraceae bacterium]|nr:DUF2752 domain-containing protein [Bryobacteraceae bacterium]